MKVLHLTNEDWGGAGRAAYRLHQGLQQISVESQMLVQSKASDDRSVLSPSTKLSKVVGRLRQTVDALPLHFYPQRDYPGLSLLWMPNRRQATVAKMTPSVINLHWICKGYLPVENLPKLPGPLVWTLHDMWAFTGGCQYTQGCDRYQDACGACPQLGSDRQWDLSHWVWHRKKRAWKDINLNIVTPSNWLAKVASSSSLFQDKRVEIIPNGIDIKKYKPINRKIAREILNLPQDKQLILFGAMSATSQHRKGFHLLQPALQNLSKSGWEDKINLVVFGASSPQEAIDFGFNARYLGKLNDDFSLALLYAAVDVFVAPSLEDNLPNTVMEAIACGTPSVAFNIGGMPDLIEHEQNGYLARPYEIEDFAQGIAWVLENPERHQKLSYRARQKTEQEFSTEKQARSYLSLYTDLLA